MASKFEAFKENIAGKRVSVMGIGVSNKPLIKMLLDCGAQVVARDRREDISSDFMPLIKMGARFVLGEKYLENIEADIIFRTPGMRPDLPELLEAKKQGAKITSEMELFFELCPCKIIGITGSDGKTTTSTLIYHLLTEEGYTCHLGGNIGNPLLPQIENIEKGDFAIVELSSFQLMTMKRSPNIAVITNITPNHLDMHKSMEEYIDAKKNIFLHQTKSAKLVINADDPILTPFTEEAKGDVIAFSKDEDKGTTVFLKDEEIWYGDAPLINKNDITIPGMHNVENYMAAIAAVNKFVKPATVRAVAKNFGGVEHRIEYVREVDGVKFYNDSIASSPTRARAGLNSFNQKVILIAGGYDKKIPFDSLGEDITKRVKRLCLLGDTADKIKDAVIAAAGGRKPMPIVKYPSLERAVKEAYMAAEAGDVVLLSPACASFDMFKNFEERGKRFKEIVRGL